MGEAARASRFGDCTPRRPGSNTLRLRKVYRRDRAKLAPGLAASRALPASASAGRTQNPGSTANGGTLTGGSAGLEGRQFDPVAWSRARFDATPRRLRFQARTRRQAETWQRQLRAKLTELLGGFPSGRTPLRPAVLETREFPGYRREKVVFDSQPGVTVLAYVLVPASASAPVPAMICIPGHGRGVDDIVGIDDQGRDRTDKSGYQHDFALQVVEAGLAAVAIEPMAFGCRRDPVNARRGLSANACQPAAGDALLLGQTMIGWRVWDVMRTVDYIATRSDLDGDRVGCVGISGGGTATLFSAALEPRLQVAMVSGYLNTFKDSVGSLSHCIDNYVPGILHWAEMYDIAGLVAPRPFFVESGEEDNIFPIAASLESVGKVREIYGVFGAADRVLHEVFPGEHAFWGKQGIPFLARHLRA
jgi:dienelactone hydrolase